MHVSKKIKLDHPTISDLVTYVKCKSLTSMSAIAAHFDISRPTLYALIDSYGNMSREEFKENISHDHYYRDLSEFQEFVGGGMCLDVMYAGVQFFVHDDFDVYRATKGGFKKVAVQLRNNKANDYHVVFVDKEGKRRSIQKLKLYYMAAHRKHIPNGYKVVMVNPNIGRYTKENLMLTPIKGRKRSDASQLLAECEQLWKEGHSAQAIAKFSDYMNKKCEKLSSQ